MHVRDLHVTRYGPLAPFEYDGFDPFTVVFGPNEQGKTLLIDALIKLLFKKELKKSREKRFGNMRRVSEHPEGYVVLRTHAEEIKLESDESLSKYFPVAVTPDDFRNVFLVRDSDLHLEDEKDYYNQITEKLTGLRSSEISGLLKIIQRKGRLRTVSPDSGLANSAEHGKVADNVRAAQRVIDEIKRVRDELAFARFDELTRELVELRRRRRVLEEQRDRERRIERRRQFERARTALAELEEIERTLNGMRDVDYRKFKEWQRIGVEREHLEKEVRRSEKAIERARKDGERVERALQGRRAKTNEADRRLRAAEKELSQRIDEFQLARLEFRRWDTVSSLARKGFLISVAVLVVALVAYVIRPSNWIGALGAVALLVSLRTGWGILRHNRSRGDLERRAESLCTDATRLGIEVETVLELQSALGDLEREVEKLRDDQRSEESVFERTQSELKSLEERRDEQRRRIGEIDAEIAGFKSSTGAGSLEDYQAAIDRRRATEASRRAQRELLQGLVPVESRGEAAVEEWRSAIETALANDEPDDGEGGGNETERVQRAARIDGEINDVTARERDVAGRLEKGGKQIYNLWMKVNDLHLPGESPRCRTLHDLDHLADRVADYCRGIERDQKLAQEAVGIFLDIDAEERERVGELFGPAAAVSTMFRAITGGRYRAVTYDVEQDLVLVQRSDGQTVRATALSGGAFDQLYLAIRVSIAEKMLPTSKGFFILDDPFIKADAQRLPNLMDTLRRIVRDGWQVIYFSAKKEVLDALADDIRSGEVKLIELDRSLFSLTAWNDETPTHTRTT